MCCLLVPLFLLVLRFACRFKVVLGTARTTQIGGGVTIAKAQRSPCGVVVGQHNVDPPQIELSPTLIERSGANPSGFHHMHSTTKMCPFEIVYGLIPRAPIDLMPLPTSEKLNFDAKQRIELMLKLHETTKENIERMNSKYKLAGDKGRKQLIFEPGVLVWLHLRKDRFPVLRKSKLMPRADGPFKVLE
jgi:hypothetical protein